ncbi:E3 ubiquitin-protein ligase TRIM7-like, partial [Cololabis saira]|uniref:E3 ubiquitin-protein ligase TRIM7-like n=1 Tax=Cololabis saira TaxID=129043 RepID=UPI002AD33B44
MKQLSDMEDQNQFLHNYPSLSPLGESTRSSGISIRPLSYFEDVTAAVSEVRGRLQDILRDTWTNISLTITEVDVLLSEPEPEPKSRAGFLKYSCEITLDPNTVNTELLLSEENRKVTFMDKHQSYSDHPDRFTTYSQVLSRESLTGRHYWEVEKKADEVEVAVSYKNISRSGDESVFGDNDKSWSLRCDSVGYGFWYDGIRNLRLRSPELRNRSLPGSRSRSSVLLRRLWNHDPPPQSPDHLHSDLQEPGSIPSLDPGSRTSRAGPRNQEPGTSIQ